MKKFAVVKLEIDDDHSDQTRDEDELLACRVCLATDTKLYNLHGCKLAQSFGDLTGTPVSKTDGLPQHICNICGILLLKAAKFRAKSRQTHISLQDARVKSPVITTENIRNMKRTDSVDLKIIDTLILEISDENEEKSFVKKEVHVESTPIDDQTDIHFDDIFTVEDSVDEIDTQQKFEEIKLENDIINNKTEETDIHFEDIFTIDNVIDEEDTQQELEEQTKLDNEVINNNTELTTVTEKTVILLDNVFTVDGSIDEVNTQQKLNEEIVLENNKTETNLLKTALKRKNTINDNKNVENKPVKKRKVSVKKTKKKTDDEKVKPKKPVKKKRMYNRKTEEDFESFAKMYNVEVVFLTREQQMAELQARKESSEYMKARFQCNECYKPFIQESAYQKHMAYHDPNAGAHICDICRVRFPTRKKMMTHLRRHRMNFVCKLCNAVTVQSTLAKQHYQWHDGLKYECQHCGKKFNKSSSHLNHVREKHASVKCDVCHQAVSSTMGLATHKAVAHSVVFKCVSCEAQFNTSTALSRHVETTAASGCDPCMSSCGQCGESFLTDQLLKKHLEKEHRNKIYRCEECNTTYNSDRSLCIHWSRVHAGRARHSRAPAKHKEKEVMCEICARSFASETSLRYHQLIHTGERPFQCSICSKRFRLKTNLQVHLNTHTGDRPYKCPVCPETFKSYSQRYKHGLMVHTKERRHKCHLCEKTYVVSFDLKKHIRTFHMKIPYPPPNRRRKNRRAEHQPAAKAS